MAARALDATGAAELVHAATAAPSMHNAQPWHFRCHLGHRTVEIRADPERALPASDPDRRALHLGCGAATCNLRAAAAAAGWRTGTVLLPDPDDPLLLAVVRLTEPTPDADPDAALAGLEPQIARRHSSRWPFTDEPVPSEDLADLVEAARAEGADLVFPDAWHAASLLELVRDAELRDAETPERAEELARWTHPWPDTADEGVPGYAYGPRRRDGAAPVRDFAGGAGRAGHAGPPGRSSVAFEARPTIALLGTAHDRPADWLRAGQALERVLLAATRAGLVASLTSQALEWSDLRALVRDPLTDVGQVQMMLRVGYGPRGPTTPRRPMSEVLEIVGNPLL
ncbi:nitroreductase family protein [Streptomyces sp. WMMC500]|uniref:Acg family FMN-binding oxidoreductase n=1 Tax=Streptomyces sp. WMMC500 TaxID=3015154 RepID=UPI00248AA808|nr:nitroreductase family protein [Streptomyces sp. WMMC500]WBB60264.1 nitroreductase family protein [Streptomyces sp. WMMC500]